jgi:hypothetical protein
METREEEISGEVTGAGAGTGAVVGRREGERKEAVGAVRTEHCVQMIGPDDFQKDILVTWSHCMRTSLQCGTFADTT